MLSVSESVEEVQRVSEHGVPVLWFGIAERHVARLCVDDSISPSVVLWRVCVQHAATCRGKFVSESIGTVLAYGPEAGIGYSWRGKRSD